MSRSEDRGTVTVEVEISEAMYQRITEVIEEDAPLFSDGDKSVSEWVKDVALGKLQEHDRQNAVPAHIDVPEEVLEKARLYAENERVERGNDATTEEWLHEFLEMEFRTPSPTALADESPAPADD